MKYLAYAIGFLASIGSIVAPIATHQPGHTIAGLVIFGLAMLAATILLIYWNKAGTVSAGAGTEDMGLTASFDVDGWQWVVLAVLVVVGVAAAVICANVH